MQAFIRYITINWFCRLLGWNTLYNPLMNEKWSWFLPNQPPRRLYNAVCRPQDGDRSAAGFMELRPGRGSTFSESEHVYFSNLRSVWNSVSKYRAVC